jgi:hypothetical protein
MYSLSCFTKNTKKYFEKLKGLVLASLLDNFVEVEAKLGVAKCNLLYLLHPKVPGVKPAFLQCTDLKFSKYKEKKTTTRHVPRNF